MAIVIDDRERALAHDLETRYGDVGISRARLGVGDVHLVQSGEVVYVIERKTRSDLRASLLDGRFADQRARMVDACGRSRCAYVIEGGTSWADADSGAEIGLVVRDDIAVFWSSDVHDTADLLARLARSDLRSRPHPPVDRLATQQNRIPVASTRCARRSLECMLRCVPGVSSRRAQAIASEFGSMQALTRRIEADRDETLRSICECRDATSRRRLGQTLAHRVAMCIDGGGIEEPAITVADAVASGVPMFVSE